MADQNRIFNEIGFISILTGIFKMDECNQKVDPVKQIRRKEGNADALQK